MSKKTRRKILCSYFCNGYCFWNGDSGEVCDTLNNSREGYCPMEESNLELTILGDCIAYDGNCEVCSNTDCLRREGQAVK